jgi:UDP:flavonoid glycosyltransferase YjiC (YdhE family)
VLWSLAGWALDQTFLPPMNVLRERAGLGPLPDTMSGWYARELNLVAVSEALRPRSDDWGTMHEVTGFLDLPDSHRFDPLPAEVDEFIRAGATPVFIGFGSLTPKDPEHIRDTLDLIEDVVQRTGCRAIVQGLAEPGAGTQSILHVGRVPHARLYPRCAAAVHHAGAGTTQTVTRAGIPSVCVPHLADQFYWGRRLYELGVAARPLRRTGLTSRRLGRRIIEVLESDAMPGRCQTLAATMGNEDGAERAAELVEAIGR